MHLTILLKNILIASLTEQHDQRKSHRWVFNSCMYLMRIMLAGPYWRRTCFSKGAAPFCIPLMKESAYCSTSAPATDAINVSGPGHSSRNVVASPHRFIFQVPKQTLFHAFICHKYLLRLGCSGLNFHRLLAGWLLGICFPCWIISPSLFSGGGVQS